MARTPPLAVKRQITLADAMLAQFKLICSDIVSIFVSDDVVANAEPKYLASLYRGMAHADEFHTISIRVESIPDNVDGRAFAEQFIGPPVLELPIEMISMRKQSRIMTHWANKIGAIVHPTVDAGGR